VHARAMREVIFPTIRGMDKDGMNYTGFLYAGLMIAPDGKIKTLEFNCRLGDPETQPILMRLKTDLVDVLMAATEQKLDSIDIQWDRRVALGVVMAATGYPLSTRKGDVVSGLPAGDSSVGNEAVVFHAGTLAKGGQTLTNGGRVLCVTVLAETVKKAQSRAHEIMQTIQFDGAQYRTDIGYRAIKA
jgi:phosphoribosylamine---glycine ligase